MRIDHIAWRVWDRHKTAKFFIDALGYKVGEEFDIPEIGARCIALRNPNKTRAKQQTIIFNHMWCNPYHLGPDVFISDGEPGSIVYEWVKEKRGPGIHHIALETHDIENTIKEWKERGWAEFSSDTYFECPGLKQIFSKPSDVTGTVWELIKRDPDNPGFCKNNVARLMASSKEERE